MIDRRIAAALFAAVLAAAAGVDSAQTPSNAPSQTHGLNDASQVLGFIHRTNLKEIKIGELGRDRASFPAARDYAEMIVKDHTNADARVKLLAQAQGIALVDDHASVARKEKATLDRLESLTGRAFDRAFMDEMADGHREAIDALGRAQRNLSGTAVGTFVAELLPQLAAHEEQARGLLTRLKNSDRAG